MGNYKQEFRKFISDAIDHLEKILDDKGTIFFYNYGRSELVKFIKQDKYSFLREGDKFIDIFLYDTFVQEAIPLKSNINRRFFTFYPEEKSKLVNEILKKTEYLQQD